MINVDISDAKSVLINMGLVPQVEYKYSETIIADNTIRCTPNVGERVSKGDKVAILVSLGPSKIISKDSYAEWTFITYGVEDDWNFSNPYIKEGVLYIDCYDVTFGTAMEWEDHYNEGSAGGIASITDTFDKTVPVRVEYDKQSYAAKESQSFTIIVPLNDLDVKKPTNIYFKIGISVKNKHQELMFNCSMTW